MERNGYQRSNSNTGFLRIGSRYVQDRKGSQFRSQSGGAGFNRNRSQSGRAGFNRNGSKSGGNGFRNGDRSGSRLSGMAKDVEEITKTLKDVLETQKALKETLEKVKANCFVEEEYEFNVRFVDESKGIQMIVDSDAPVSIATSKSMERYSKEMEVKKDEMIEK